MKKSMKFRFSTLVCTMAVAMLFTNDLGAQAPTKGIFAEMAMNKMVKRFDFSINLSHCFAGGTSIRIGIDKPAKYAFLWEINGGAAGHEMNVECACGQYATVRVMRLSDGLLVTRTVKLAKCGNDDE